jgi:hypothetical protein
MSLGNKNIWKKLETFVFIMYIWGKMLKILKILPSFWNLKTEKKKNP